MGNLPWPKYVPKGQFTEGVKTADTQTRRRQMRLARKAEEQFVKLHGMSSMDHMELYMKGQNVVVDGCECFACAGHRHRQMLAERESRKLHGYTMKQALKFQALLGLKN
jgi:hypothetical protein